MYIFFNFEYFFSLNTYKGNVHDLAVMHAVDKIIYKKKKRNQGLEFVCLMFQRSVEVSSRIFCTTEILRK